MLVPMTDDLCARSVKEDRRALPFFLSFFFLFFFFCFRLSGYRYCDVLGFVSSGSFKFKNTSDLPRRKSHDNCDGCFTLQ